MYHITSEKWNILIVFPTQKSSTARQLMGFEKSWWIKHLLIHINAYFLSQAENDQSYILSVSIELQCHLKSQNVKLLLIDSWLSLYADRYQMSLFIYTTNYISSTARTRVSGPWKRAYHTLTLEGAILNRVGNFANTNNYSHLRITGCFTLKS